jgi:hypothetical protein
LVGTELQEQAVVGTEPVSVSVVVFEFEFGIEIVEAGPEFGAGLVGAEFVEVGFEFGLGFEAVEVVRVGETVLESVVGVEEVPELGLEAEPVVEFGSEPVVGFEIVAENGLEVVADVAVYELEVQSYLWVSMAVPELLEASNDLLLFLDMACEN